MVSVTQLFYQWSARQFRDLIATYNVIIFSFKHSQKKDFWVVYIICGVSDGGVCMSLYLVRAVSVNVEELGLKVFLYDL